MLDLLDKGTALIRDDVEREHASEEILNSTLAKQTTNRAAFYAETLRTK